MMLAQAAAALLTIAALAVTPSPERVPAPGVPGLHPKTIAVISGLNKDANLLAVQLIAQALAKDGRLTALSAEQTAAKLKDYPINVRGPFQSAYATSTVDYDNTDVATVRRLKQKLGVDYLYVVWMYGSSSDSFGQVSHNFLTQLFEGQEGPPVFNGGFSSTAAGGCGGFTLCLGIKFKHPTGEQMARQLKEDCALDARKIGKEIAALQQQTEE